jgi:hypothetical protein
VLRTRPAPLAPLVVHRHDEVAATNQDLTEGLAGGVNADDGPAF